MKKAFLSFALPLAGALVFAANTMAATTGSFVFNVTAVCPAGTSTTATPPTCFLPDSYRIDQLVGTTWTKVAVLAPATPGSPIPTTYTMANLPIPTVATFRVVPMLFSTDGAPSPSVVATLALTNMQTTIGVTVTVP